MMDFYDILLAKQLSGGGGGGSAGAVELASGTFTGTGANNVTFTIGTKMAKTDFVFAFKCTEESFVYDSYYKFSDGAYVMLRDYAVFDFSTTGNDRPAITSLSYDVDNSGTITAVKPNARFFAAQNIRNTSVNAFCPAGFVVNYQATGFTAKITQANVQYNFPNGAKYDWKILYFGNSPSTDIIEVA